MIRAINSKAYGAIRDSVIEGMDIAWKQGMGGIDTAWKHGKRVHLRTPWTYDKSSGMRTGGWISLGILSIAAMALGAWFYFRKRKQVADHYTMGQGPAQTWEPEKTPVDGQKVDGQKVDGQTVPAT